MSSRSEHLFTIRHAIATHEIRHQAVRNPSEQRPNRYWRRHPSGDGEWIAKRARKAIECDRHDIALGELDRIAETQAVRAVKMDVQIAGAAMGPELEMVMLDVGEAVAHFCGSGGDLALPDDALTTLDRHAAWHRMKIRVQHNLRAQRRSAKFGTREIQVISLFELVIGEFVSSGHADAAGLACGIDQIDSRYFGFLAAVFGVGRHDERLAVGAQNRAGAFVKPFRRRADATRLRAASVQ